MRLCVYLFLRVPYKALPSSLDTKAHTHERELAYLPLLLICLWRLSKRH